MKKTLMFVMVITMIALAFVGCSSNAEPTEGEQAAEEKTYQYYTADELKGAIENQEDVLIVDIQVEEEYNEHHIEGVIPTYAYPVKTDEEKAKLETVLPELEASEAPIVIVCPGGAGGAQRSIDHLTEKGIAADRLFILENGQGKWPHDELLAK